MLHVPCDPFNLNRLLDLTVRHVEEDREASDRADAALATSRALTRCNFSCFLTEQRNGLLMKIHKAQYDQFNM